MLKEKRRTIKDLDQDMVKVKENINNINEGMLEILEVLNAKHQEKPEDQQQSKTAIELEHQEEFGEYKKTENEEVEELKLPVLPEFEISPVIYEWVLACAEYHNRTVEQELQLMVKQLYYKSKAAIESEASLAKNKK